MKICIVETASLGPAQRDKSLLNIKREFPCELDGENVIVGFETLKLIFEILRYSYGSSLVIYDGEVQRGIYQPNLMKMHKS